MAAVTGTVWAIDIGNNSLKALCLSTERGVAEVIGFENIQHGKILSSGNVTEDEREELIAISLRELVTKYDLSMDEIVVSVPSQNSFVRFVNLPPVEAKRIPEMVKFEAVQQIPFGINDVQWDWQLMSEPESPEIKVGIFAIKNDIVNSALNPLAREDIEVSYVQIAPMALYNYLLYDRPDLFTSEDQAVVILNVGAENTDLVVCTKSTVWQRCVLIGGNTFTQAIADTFKLNFDKAEKLKRTAPMSKYARQIFQAMRPVFTDLASEVQRSIGFYNSSNPNVKIKKIVAMGGGAKLRGLLKYLQQTLQTPAERPDSFKRLALNPSVSQAKFHESVTDFGIVYGLALQGLGMGRIESNLLPRAIARSRAWASKGRYFITAACLLLAVSLMSFGKTFWSKMQYDRHSPDRLRWGTILNEVQAASNDEADIQMQKDELKASIENAFKVFDYRDTVMRLVNMIDAARPNEKNNPQQAQLYEAFARGDAEEVRAIPRKQRKQIFLTNMVYRFTTDLANTQFQEMDFSQQMSAYGIDAEAQRTLERQAEAARLAAMQQVASGRSLYGNETTTTEEQKDSGFLVTLVGYCPYGYSEADVRSLLDPPNTGNDRSKWGFVTRLEHMDQLADPNEYPFQVYDKINSDSYKLDVEVVRLDEGYPVGTGVEKTKTYSTSIGSYNIQYQLTDIPLVDPLTREPVSAVLKPDGTVGEVNDHWFTLKIKFLWKDAPEPPAISFNDPYQM
ncbi:MAG: type IV pilus assembly protein PilM [Sedimentisphaerales bacterium]